MAFDLNEMGFASGIGIVQQRAMADQQQNAQRLAAMQINSQNVQLRNQAIVAANQKAQLDYLNAQQQGKAAQSQWEENNVQVGNNEYIAKDAFSSLSQADQDLMRSVA